MLGRPNILRLVSAALAALTICAFSTPALAQDRGNEAAKSAPTSVPIASEGLTLNLNSVPLSGFDRDFDPLGEMTVPRLDLPVGAVGSTLFQLDVTDTSCLTGNGSCASRKDRLSLGLSHDFTAASETGLDVMLRPRASLSFEDDASSALVGAVVEIGEDLRRGSELKPKTWYVFAGADAEALTYSPDSLSKLSTGQFHLQDRIIVGDAQAGLGYRIGDADVSLSYMRREATAEDFSYTEDAAALSFTWKR